MKKNITAGIVFFFLIFSVYGYGNDDILADKEDNIIDNPEYSEDQIFDDNSNPVIERKPIFSFLRRNRTSSDDNILEEESPDLLAIDSVEDEESARERISMQVAFNNDDGACAFRALLGIAETRTGQNLTFDQLNEAREMYYGSARNRNWWVTIRRADGKTQGSSHALEDVINIGLELLGSNERALFVKRVGSPPNNNIPAGTQATFIRVAASTSSNSHFLEGDANGNMIYDPLHALERYKSRTITRFDAIRFHTPE